IILTENNVDKAISYVVDVINKLKENKIELSKVIIYTQLQKELSAYEQHGPHVAAAKRMEKKGISVGPGTMISYVIVSGDEKIRDRARLPEEVAQKDYDPEYYINNQVIPAVESIFNVLNIDIKEIIQNRKQSKLGQFFR
ncbi:MAG: DNA polymerase, partial [Candidatus Woesearchaeota archaeon]|nr:DNA polymerase [Candidatus Woesearchaeota archaeon]